MPSIRVNSSLSRCDSFELKTYGAKQKQPTTQKVARLPLGFAFAGTATSAAPVDCKKNTGRVRKRDGKYPLKVTRRRNLSVFTSVFVYLPSGQSIVISVPSSVMINASASIDRRSHQYSQLRPFLKTTIFCKPWDGDAAAGGKNIWNKLSMEMGREWFAYSLRSSFCSWNHHHLSSLLTVHNVNERPIVHI